MDTHTRKHVIVGCIGCMRVFEITNVNRLLNVPDYISDYASTQDNVCMIVLTNCYACASMAARACEEKGMGTCGAPTVSITMIYFMKLYEVAQVLGYVAVYACAPTFISYKEITAILKSTSEVIYAEVTGYPSRSTYDMPTVSAHGDGWNMLFMPRVAHP